YQQYLVEKPDAPEAGELQGRIGVLRSRVVVTTIKLPVEPPLPKRPFRSAGIGVLVGALVLAGIGGVLVGTVDGDFKDLEATCGRKQCGPSDWSSLKARADAGYAMFALAGAAAIADVTLWALDHRQVQLMPAGLRVRF